MESLKKSTITKSNIGGVIYTAGGSGIFSRSTCYYVDYVGVNNLLQVLGEQKYKFVYVSSAGVTGFWRSLALNIALGNYGKWKYETEKLIKSKKGITYTIVRPGVLVSEKRKHGICIVQGDNRIWWSNTSRDSVAEALVESLYSSATDGKTFEIFDEPNNKEPSNDEEWKTIFSKLN